MRHTVCFVENNDFVGRAGVSGGLGGGGRGDGSARKVFDLFADDRDATFVGSVEFEDAGLHEFGSDGWVRGCGENGRCGREYP